MTEEYVNRYLELIFVVYFRVIILWCYLDLKIGMNYDEYRECHWVLLPRLLSQQAFAPSVVHNFLPQKFINV